MGATPSERPHFKLLQTATSDSVRVAGPMTRCKANGQNAQFMIPLKLKFPRTEFQQTCT